MPQLRELERDLNSQEIPITDSELFQLKQMLKGNGLDKKVIKYLKQFGIRTEMKNRDHILLTNGNTNYSCAKTPSDHRNGRNVFAGIRQTFFPQSYQTN